jgi:hypothetical protein
MIATAGSDHKKSAITSKSELRQRSRKIRPPVDDDVQARHVSITGPGRVMTNDALDRSDLPASAILPTRLFSTLRPASNSTRASQVSEEGIFCSSTSGNTGSGNFWRQPRKPPRYRRSSSPAFRAHNFHPATRRRQVSVSGSVGLADLDVAATDVVIFVCNRRSAAGGRSCLFDQTLRLGFF